jgi:UDPglucose 6-dehydrogenase
MKVTVIGSGYVGLVTAACFASVGHKVTCLDSDNKKTAKLKKGIIPIYEPGLSEMVKTAIGNNSLSFTTSYNTATKNNIFFLCVGTPDKNGRPDLQYIHAVRDSLCEALAEDSCIFIKSTVPIGTNRALEDRMNKALKKQSLHVKVASNPEFLKEGSAVNDFLKPDRIIIGSHDEELRSIAKKIFQPFNWQNKRLIFMKRESAELTKYASNAFLATKISFMNEMSWLAEEVGADIHEIRKGMGSDNRIGSSFLYAGLGYGGSCFPKDVNSLIHSQKMKGYKDSMLSATKKVNNRQFELFARKIINYFSKNSKSIEIALWGLSFKPGTDDIRESVAIKMVKMLSPRFKKIYIYDPLAIDNSRKELKALSNIVYCTNKNKSITKLTQALIVCTEWKEFWTLEEVNLKNIRVIFDGRNIYSSKKFESSPEIDYFGIGV